MPQQLVDLRVDEISLVDAPANKSARILIYKRNATEDDMAGDTVDVTKSAFAGLSPEAARAQLRKSGGAAGVAAAAGRRLAAERGAVPPQGSQDPVFAIVEERLAKIEAGHASQAEEIAKLRLAAMPAQVELFEKATALSKSAGGLELAICRGRVLATEPGLYDRVCAEQKLAAAQTIQKAGMDGVAAHNKLVLIAERIRQANPKLSREQSMAQAIKGVEGSALYAQMSKRHD